MASAAAPSAIDSSSPPMVDPTAPGDSRDTRRVDSLSYFFPAHDEAENIEQLVAEALARAAPPGRRGSRSSASTTAARTAPAPSPTASPPSTRTSCGSSITASTRATARPSAAAWGPRDIRSCASPTATASSASPTCAALLDRMRRARRPGLAGAPGRRRGLPHQARRPAHPAGLRAGLPGVPAAVLRPPGARRRLRLQAVPARGAGGHPADIGRCVPVARSCSSSCARCGGRVVEVGVPHHPRTAGRASGADPRVVLRAVRDFWRLRLLLWARPREALRTGEPALRPQDEAGSATSDAGGRRSGWALGLPLGAAAQVDLQRVDELPEHRQARLLLGARAARPPGRGWRPPRRWARPPAARWRWRPRAGRRSRARSPPRLEHDARPIGVLGEVRDHDPA